MNGTYADVSDISPNELEYYYSYAEVDLRAIRQNLKNMQAACDRKIIPVAKGNAWGQGLLPVVSSLFDKGGCDTVAVAQVIEGKKIRDAGYKDQTIMILSGVPFHAIPYVVKYNLLMEVYNIRTVEILSAEVRKAGLDKFPVQIKVDSGLHRIGVTPEYFDELIRAIEAAGNLEIVGIMTHYTEESEAKMQEQYDVFKEVVLKFKAMGYDPQYISAGCSTNIEFPKEDICTHLRAGWGYIAYADDIYDYFYGNKPSLSLRAFITNIVDLKPGDTLGYSDKVLEKETKVACISIGLCDGVYRRMVMNGGPLLIKGKYAHYLDFGMDQIMIDVTGIDCQIGDEVTLYGRDKYSDAFLGRKEVSKYSDGNCSILELYLTDRVKRVYIDD